MLNATTVSIPGGLVVGAPAPFTTLILTNAAYVNKLLVDRSRSHMRKLATVALTRRDLYVDYWRGLFHVALLVDHLPVLFPGLFTLIAGFYEAVGYVSVAEGFVFLSGYVTGLVYTRVYREAGQRALWRKSLRRAFTIYATYVGAVVLLLILSKSGIMATISLPSWGHLLEEPLPIASAQVAGLIWQPDFLEILPMYCLFLLFSPLAITQLDRKRFWLVIGASILLWAAGQFGFRGKLLEAAGIEAVRFGYFHFLSWQILFTLGLVCGHRTYCVNAPWLPKGTILPVVACILAAGFFACRHHVLKLPASDSWTQRSSLGLLRLLNFSCVAFLVALFRGKIEKLIRWRGFVFLSEHSLQVFAFHLFPICFAALLVAGRTELTWLTQLLFVGFCTSGLFYIAWIAKMTKGWWRKSTGTQIAPMPIQSAQRK